MDLVTQLWSLVGLLSLVRTFIPPPLRDFLDRMLAKFWDKLFSSSRLYTHVEIPEYKGGWGWKWNPLYRDVDLYLSSMEKASATERVNIFRPQINKRLTFTLAMNEEVEDSFQGSSVWWVHNSIKKEKEQQNSEERRKFSLKMLKDDRKRFLTQYLDHISQTAAVIERREAVRYLYTNEDSKYWDRVPFNHPCTFETLAMEPELKELIKADLIAFAQGENFYHRVGRAWKRGYLLYGPPGTGKSSMIAAMANFLQYDVYDLELTKVSGNSALRSLLIQTSPKSILVIEDIDCTLDVSDRSVSKGTKRSETSKNDKVDEKDAASDKGSRVTLSGLLNFTDGLWSCCGEERIIVFTTNYKDRLDPALLRSGRMDFHILLSYCTFAAFKLLASNYLRIEDHELYPVIERLIDAGAEATPADVAELLIGNKDDAGAALESVISALQKASAKKGSGGGKESNMQEGKKEQKASGRKESGGGKESHTQEGEKEGVMRGRRSSISKARRKLESLMTTLQQQKKSGRRSRLEVESTLS